MLERISKMAEQTANNLSRRKFLGKLSEKALPAIAMLGALFATSTKASAQSSYVKCCRYSCRLSYRKYCVRSGNCPVNVGLCELVSYQNFSDCSYCRQES